MKLPIEVTMDNEKYIEHIGDDCGKCHFHINKKSCALIPCESSKRKDSNDVYFVKVSE